MEPFYLLLFPTGTESIQEITLQFRKLALANHPDKRGSDEAMASLNQAYRAVLRQQGIAQNLMATYEVSPKEFESVD